MSGAYDEEEMHPMERKPVPSVDAGNDRVRGWEVSIDGVDKNGCILVDLILQVDQICEASHSHRHINAEHKKLRKTFIRSYGFDYICGLVMWSRFENPS